ncbi:MAG: tripartite tricarboxylate transporter substrate binding protein [Proteobacteria bacterium]|nr:tripartite tricarboxylate transporter substrate binding protein [Burkholderiales bacterium]
MKRSIDAMTLAALAVVASTVMYPRPALAADATQSKYPTRPVRLVVPFPPGAASDFLGRTLGQRLFELWGQQIVVDNRPGGGGILGGQIVSKAAPDGYTMALVGTPHLAAPLLQKELPYRPIEDFTMVTQVASLANVLVVAPQVPVTTLKEFLAYAKARPGQLNMGSAGIGSGSHMAGEFFRQAAGIDTVHVPFKLLSDAISEMLSGRVHYYVFPVAAIAGQLKEGKLRAIAVTSGKRASGFPEVPAMTDAGMPGFIYDTWFGIIGPAKLPAPVVERWTTDVARALKEPEMVERMLRSGSDPAPSSPAQFLELMRTEYPRYAKLIKQANLKIE